MTPAALRLPSAMTSCSRATPRCLAECLHPRRRDTLIIIEGLTGVCELDSLPIARSRIDAGFGW